MMSRVAPSVIQQRLDDDPNKTIFHAVCLNIHNVPDAFRTMQLILQCCPEVAASSMPSEDHDMPLHWLCNSNPSPRVLQLVLDAYPQAATTANDEGLLPIHSLVSTCRCPESLKMLLDAAPGCMQHSDVHGTNPLHSAASHRSHDGKIPEEYFVPLLQACRGQVLLDNCPPKSKEARLHVLGMMRDWVVSANCKHGSLVKETLTLDVGGCELGEELVPILKDLLPHCVSLTLLDLSANSLCREHVEGLLPVILQMPKLHRLVLDDNFSDAEDAAITLSMISAPHLEVSVGCKVDDTADENLQGILWGNGDSNDESSYEYEYDCDDEDENAEGSDSSGWVTEEEDDDGVADTCEQVGQISIAQANGDATYPADMEPLQALFFRLEKKLHGSEAEQTVVGRCEGVYDSDEADAAIAEVCGIDEAEDDSDSDSDTEHVRVAIEVERAHLIESSLGCLRDMSAKDAAHDIEVVFEDEDGVDQGGLTKTYLTMVTFPHLVSVRFILTLFFLKVLERLITPGNLFLPGVAFIARSHAILFRDMLAVIVNSEIAYLRLNPSLNSVHPTKQDDAVWTRPDECLKLLGFAIGKCMMKGALQQLLHLCIFMCPPHSIQASP